MIITKWRLTLVIFQIMISNMNLSTISTEIAHTMGRCWGSVTTCGEATRIVPGLTVMGVFCLAVTAVTESTSISLWISILFKPIHSSQRVQNSTYVSSIPSKSSTKSWSKLFCLVLILRKIYLPLYWCPMAMFIFVVFHHKFFRNIVNFCLISVYNSIYII